MRRGADRHGVGARDPGPRRARERPAAVQLQQGEGRAGQPPRELLDGLHRHRRDRLRTRPVHEPRDLGVGEGLQAHGSRALEFRLHFGEQLVETAHALAVAGVDVRLGDGGDDLAPVRDVPSHRLQHLVGGELVVVEEGQRPGRHLLDALQPVLRRTAHEHVRRISTGEQGRERAQQVGLAAAVRTGHEDRLRSAVQVAEERLRKSLAVLRYPLHEHSPLARPDSSSRSCYLIFCTTLDGFCGSPCSALQGVVVLLCIPVGFHRGTRTRFSVPAAPRLGSRSRGCAGC